MPLTQLKTKLDSTAIVGEFLGSLTGQSAALNATSPPVSPGALSGAASISASADVGPLQGAITRVAAQMPAMLEALPDVRAVVGPVTSALDLVEKATAHDLAAQLRSLVAKISAELDQGRGSGFTQVLERLGALFGDAPELAPLLDVLRAAFAAAHAPVGPEAILTDVLPALLGSVRGIGALMSLESSLAEGERLTLIMARQVDPAQVAPATAGLLARFDQQSAALADLVAAAPSPEVADSAARDVRECAARLAEVEALLASAMGFGEATLVHFDIGRLTSDVEAATGILRTVDADVIARAVSSLVAKLQPVLSLDLGAAPAQGLDAVLRLLEEKTAAVAAAIAAVDVTTVSAPVQRGIGGVSGALATLTNAVTSVTSAIRGALEQVRQLVASLPLDEITRAINAVLTPITQAIDAIRQLVAGVEAALRNVAQAVTGTLGTIEHAIDDFKARIEGLLNAAAQFVDSLHLDQIIGTVAGQVNAFADALGKAQMKPYFDTAVNVIGTTADVIQALPLSLMPDSMRPQLDAALAPARDIDLDQVRSEIEGLLEIKDGKFALRQPLEAAVADIQAKYDALMKEVANADPRQLVAPIDSGLATVRSSIANLTPQLSLQPVQDAITRVKASLGAFDLRTQLKPLNDAFARVLAAVDDYSPEKLIAPLAKRLTAARDGLLQAIKLRQWGDTLDQLKAQGLALIDRLDPSRLEGALGRALAEANRLLDQLGTVHPAGSFGDFVATLLSGTGLRVHSWTFDTVAGWLTTGSGRGALEARAERIARNIATTRDAVRAVDLAALGAGLAGHVAAMRASIARLNAGSPARTTLEDALDRVQADSVIATLTTNAARYLTALDAATTQSDVLRRTGLSQVDVSIASLQRAFAPASALRRLWQSVLGTVGITDFGGGLAGVLRRALDVATPTRLAAIFAPIFTALKGRVVALVDALIAPLKAGIAQIITLANAIDLAPVQQAIAAVVAELRGKIESLSPLRVLGPSLDAFDALKRDLLAFDPLQSVRQVIDALVGTATRVLAKLDAATLLAPAIHVYDTIVGALRSLKIETLLAPVLNQLDAIAGQVDDGLARTVQALQRLQAALPPPGGGGGAAAVALSGSLG